MEQTLRIHRRILAFFGESTGMPRDLTMDSAAPGHTRLAFSAEASALLAPAALRAGFLAVNLEDMLPST